MTAPPGHAALSLAHVSKSFPAIQALRDVSFTVAPGEVRALLGNNGSGKSTLVKVLAGVHRGDRGGSIAVGGEQIAADRTSAGWARARGLRFVHQQPGLFPELSVAENLALATTYPTRRGGAVDWKLLHDRADALLRRFAIDAASDARLSALGPAERVLFAIARALDDARDARILVLDEPTALLSADRSQAVWRGLRHAVDRGHAVLFVSHRLDEVVAEADTATVLRDGSVVASLFRSELTEGALAAAMTGKATSPRLHPPASTRPARGAGDEPAVALDVDQLRGERVRGVTFAVRGGEVLGIAGPIGAGQSELLEMLFGARRVRGGTIRLHGRPAPFDDIGGAMRAGVAYVPADRAGAVFSELALFENMTAASMRSFGSAIRVRRDRELVFARLWMDALLIRAFSPRQTMATVSGGNQQKALLARWLSRQPSVLLLSEPTQGVDVEARADIHVFVRDAAESGCAVVVTSGDFRELASLCDRVLIMVGGIVIAERAGDDVTAASLAELALATYA